MKLSQAIPIYDITPKGVIISDTKGNLTICLRIHLPILFTMGEKDFEEMIENFRKFTELLGDDILIHRQDFYHRKYFSLKNIEEPLSQDKAQNFLERAYNTHFNERPFLQMKSYMYVTKINSGNAGLNRTLISKEFASVNETNFINSITNGVEILKKNGIQVEFLSREDLLSKNNPISKYYNFSDTPIEQLRDVSFANNSTYVGTTKIDIYTIENLEQFPTESIGYSTIKNGLPVSNMFSFSYAMGIPHVLNQYLYVPNQREELQKVERKESSLRGWDMMGANSVALEENALFKLRTAELGCKMAYYHFNVMTFDDTAEVAEKQVNIAFAESGFKKKENTLSRKDLFLSAIPSNGGRIVEQRKNLMSLVSDLEALCFFNWEQNYEDISSAGLRLCDRIYGIPFSVDIFEKPLAQGLIKNKNSLILAGSGGGKSFTANLILLNLYLQGAHIFCIDASYSYLLQCKEWHKGVYLNFDDKNKISFNPFYMEWLKEEEAVAYFKGEKIDKQKEHQYIDLLTDKINTIIGVLTAMTKDEGENTTRFESSIYQKIIYQYFKYCSVSGEVEQIKFDHFYLFVSNNIQQILEEKNIGVDLFNPHSFLMMLEEFCTGNTFGYLLNSMDDKIKNLEKERFVVIDVSNIRRNKILFSIVSVLSMDLYNQKVAKLPMETVKVLNIDEAWQSISSPEMASFMKQQVKVIRKYGGQTMFISQELDDFISSEIIKDSIINNSSIKIFADMGEFVKKFEPIKKVMAISDVNEAKIKSLNQNNREGAKYKEVCICWENRGEVYAVETPLELKAIFETNSKELAKILPNVKKYGIELASVNYAEIERNKI